MCVLKILICLTLLASASVCIYYVNNDKKMEQQSVTNEESPCEKEYKGYCLNGECYNLEEEGIIGCTCSWFYGGKRCEKYLWWN